MQDSYEVSKLLRGWKMEKSEGEGAPWTREDRLRKSARDLVESEQDYVKVLHPKNRQN